VYIIYAPLEQKDTSSLSQIGEEEVINKYGKYSLLLNISVVYFM